MRILAIETSGPRGSVALLDGAQLVAERAHSEPNAHAETLMRMIDGLIAESGWARSSLDGVAVGLGPGSFTGLRVGVALAHGLALGLGRPVFGVSSLRALAAALQRNVAADDPTLLFGALTDARRGEYFFAAFEASLKEHIPTQAIAQSAAFPTVLERIGQRTLHLAGAASFFPDSRDLRLHVCLEPAFQAPSAAHVGWLAQTNWTEADALPLYLRDADAVVPNIIPNALLPRDNE